MRAINEAIEGADAFTKMMEKTVERRVATRVAVAPNPVHREVAEWNAAVEKKKAEKLARKRAKAMR